MRGEPLFTWEGDDTEIDRLSTEFEALAANPRSEWMTIANNVLQVVGEKGLPTEETARHEVIAWIIYGLSHTDRHRSEHPGKYLDYVSSWDFELDLWP